MRIPRLFKWYLCACSAIAAGFVALLISETRAIEPPPDESVVVVASVLAGLSVVVSLLIPYGIVAAGVVLWRRCTGSPNLRGAGGAIRSVPAETPAAAGCPPRRGDLPTGGRPGDAGRTPAFSDAPGPAARPSGEGVTAGAQTRRPAQETADASPSEVNAVVPPHVRLLAEALRPLRARVRERLAEPPESAPAIALRTDMDLADAVAFSGRENRDNLQALADALNAVGRLSATESGAVSVRRAVRRIEVGVDALLDGFGEVREWDVRARNRHVRDMMEDLHRHYLTAILDWLDRLIEGIADPVSALKAQGLLTSGNVYLDMHLVLEAPPQLAELERWLERNVASDDEPSYERARPSGSPSGPGFLGTVAASVLGFAIGDWLFKDDE